MDVISDYVLTDLQPIFTGEIEGFKRMFKELFKNMAEENQDSSSGAKKGSCPIVCPNIKTISPLNLLSGKMIHLHCSV